MGDDLLQKTADNSDLIFPHTNFLLTPQFFMSPKDIHFPSPPLYKPTTTTTAGSREIIIIKLFFVVFEGKTK